MWINGDGEPTTKVEVNVKDGQDTIEKKNLIVIKVMLMMLIV
jgi:hypothetical protein